MIHGKNSIGNELSAEGSEIIQSFRASDYEILSGDFVGATKNEFKKAIEKSKKAFETYRHFSGAQKATFLKAIADEIEALGNELIQRACDESGLPEGRITGERGRTTGQLRMFAQLLEEGSWVEARIETADPNRSPMPKPDLRKMLFPLGPVAVFGASNFPLAFSTAGGDTASALAAGCPVIVKAHNSHLGTNELVAGAIIKAAEKTGMPDGVFSSLTSTDYTIGQKLVAHREISAVGFTGSPQGGKALFDIAAQREIPIPVFAEMGSVNPVVLLPNELEKNTKNIAETFAHSITLGVGQFCTNPGLLFAIKGEALDRFKTALSDEILTKPYATMLNKGIAKNYSNLTEKAVEENGVETVVFNKGKNKLFGSTIAAVDASEFIVNPNLHQEIFGPFSLIVECESIAEITSIIENMEGQLTLSLMGNSDDFKHQESLVNTAKEKAGRLIFNAAPTGVEVNYAMHHGGPFPATTNSQHTSVGQDAIKRFVRPISFQSAPESFLPPELKDQNPMNIMRKVNGKSTREKI